MLRSADRSVWSLIRLGLVGGHQTLRWPLLVGGRQTFQFLDPIQDDVDTGHRLCLELNLRPLHRSGRAALPHPAPTLGADARRWSGDGGQMRGTGNVAPADPPHGARGSGGAMRGRTCRTTHVGIERGAQIEDRSPGSGSSDDVAAHGVHPQIALRGMAMVATEERRYRNASASIPRGPRVQPATDPSAGRCCLRDDLPGHLPCRAC